MATSRQRRNRVDAGKYAVLARRLEGSTLAGARPNRRREPFYLILAFLSKEGQLWRVAAKTSWAGMPRHLIPKTVQERGNAGSQVMRKWTQRRQFGA